MSSDLPAEGKRGEASQEAEDAASWVEVMEAGRIGPAAAADVLAAAHDPALGEDRSVRLGAVMEWLESRLEGPRLPGACVTVNLDGFACEFARANTVEMTIPYVRDLLYGPGTTELLPEVKP